MDKHTVYVLWKKRNFEFATHIHIPILVSRMETRKFFRFTEWNPEIFPIYIMEPGNFSGLRKGNWNLLCLGNETVCRIET